MKVRVAMGFPWYAGADRDCVTNFLLNQQYLGRLQERLWWLNNSPLGSSVMADLPPMDRDTPSAEIGTELLGTEFEFAIADEVGCSLPGMARERIVDNCLAWGADYIFWSDADMAFGTDTFLRLYMDKRPIVAALAFTGRPPITPVIYKFEGFGQSTEADGVTRLKFHADPVFDYERDALQQVDAIGSGVMLINCEVFKQIPKPWFTSYGVGEDIWFCAMAKQHGVPVYVDTRVKTSHKPTFQLKWHNEGTYDLQRAGKCIHCAEAK